jgi:hypothetical protein
MKHEIKLESINKVTLIGIWAWMYYILLTLGLINLITDIGYWIWG